MLTFFNRLYPDSESFAESKTTVITSWVTQFILEASSQFYMYIEGISFL